MPRRGMREDFWPSSVLRMLDEERAEAIDVPSLLFANEPV
jgi:hypothetical protein